MNYPEFADSLTTNVPPPSLSPLLLALWYDGRDDWHAAHIMAQDVETDDGSWVHAYLHRREGDLSNAQYWYRKAHRKFPDVPLKEEWKLMVSELLQR